MILHELQILGVFNTEWVTFHQFVGAAAALEFISDFETPVPNIIIEVLVAIDII